MQAVMDYLKELGNLGQCGRKLCMKMSKVEGDIVNGLEATSCLDYSCKE